jgi:predicted nuclease of predicted toxin-antitoxin system
LLKILVDEDLPRSTAPLLQSLGVNACDVRDVGLKGASDAVVFEYAQKEERAILTRDVEFGSILKYPQQNHHGVIVIRLPNIYVRDQILKVIRKFFIEIGRQELAHKIVVLEADNYRIRPLSQFNNDEP